MRTRAPVWLRERWGVRVAAAVAAAAVVAVALVLSGVALVLLQERSVRSSVEDQARAQALNAVARLEDGESPRETVTEIATGFVLLQVLDAGGTVLAASPQLSPTEAVDGGATAADPDSTATATVGDDPLLVVREPAAGSLVVLAGGSLAAAEQSTETVTQLAVVGVPLLALVAGAATYLFAGLALRPVEAIRSRVAAITGEDLAGRVPEPVARDEVGRLARTMNDMLSRLQAAQVAQRRFVGDASHELRSPLATITARLELAGRRGPTAGDVAVMVPEAHRMARLIEDLLLLARADERGLVPRRDDVDLDELADDAAAHLRATSAVTVRVTTVPVRVTGDRAQLARVLRNLVDNAARHANSRVTILLRPDGTEAVLEVADDGPGIPPADRARVFDRFVRLDEGRARDAGGVGLGLAIVAEVLAAHGGSVEAGTADEGGALMRVRLPCRPAGGVAPPAEASDPVGTR